jgi:hypothetical protein
VAAQRFTVLSAQVKRRRVSVPILRDVPNTMNARFWDETGEGIYIKWPADVRSKLVTVRVRVFGVDAARIKAELERDRDLIQRAAQLKYEGDSVVTLDRV